MRSLMVWLHVTEIDALIRSGLMRPEQRGDLVAISDAVQGLLSRAFEEAV
jgi:hypothetical protein